MYVLYIYSYTINIASMNIKCKICGYETSLRGLMPHVKQKHSVSLQDYVDTYGEYRARESRLLEKTKDADVECKICNTKCASERHFTYHLKMHHNITKRQYIIKHLLNNSIPLCKCGCGQPVKITDRGKPPYWSNYISGHNIYDTHIGAKRSHESKMKMRESAIKRLSDKNSVFFYNGTSKQELDFGSWLKDELGLNVVFNDKSILSGLELDFYIPDKKIAIEINGIRFHSDLYKDRLYHLKKTEECNNLGIRLIHIWSCDLLNKPDIVKSQIKYILGLNQYKIYARHCKIKPISNTEASLFLNINHLQGTVVSKYRYGLYHNDELVQIMTFGNSRYSQNKSKIDQAYELLRLCTKIDTAIIGGSSRLYKHFINTHNPKYIFSYANRDWSIGSIYSILGMTHVGYTPPGYFYSNGKAKLTRYQCQKHNLIKLGFNKELSEYDIMQSRGYYRVWDSGNIKYESFIT